MFNFFNINSSKSSGIDANWARARKKWTSRKVVYAGKTGKLLKLSAQARCVLDLVKQPKASDYLFKKIEDPDCRVSAYCIIGLELLNARNLNYVDSVLKDRVETIIVESGSSVIEMPLSVFAEEAAKRHREGRSLDRWLFFGKE